jgi:ABC-type nickel/cobalt efflux system permease component RcnA
MGNFSISHYAGIRVESSWIEIRYILDMAEIPTFQEMQQASIVAQPGDFRVVVYLARKAEILKSGLELTLDGRPVGLETVSQNIIFPPGAGGLSTMKVGMLYRGLLPGAPHPGELWTLNYRDNNYAGRAGWKEVVATTGPGLTLNSSTAASVSRSQELSDYPTDLIDSPPQDLSLQLTFTVAAASQASSAPSRPAVMSSQVEDLALGSPPIDPRPSLSQGQALRGGDAIGIKSSSLTGHSRESENPRVFTETLQPRPSGTPGAAAGLARSKPVTLEVNKQGTPSSRFTRLITSNQWGLWFLLTAALTAAALGGLHALEPGHGKTIVAAYLVGSQGTAAHALLLGLIVTATHTAGVYALGAVTLYASKYLIPDHLYPWLGIASGLTIAFVGAYMIRRRYAGHERGHHHYHGRDAVHEHGRAHHDGHADHTRELGHEEHTHLQRTSHAGGHFHTHGHAHEHTHSHSHGHYHDEHLHNGPFSYRRLALLGVTGGITPCPAALVVLLSAVSLHRVAFGLYLILAFSLGLAAVLISIGLITVYARRLLARVPSDGLVINRWLPIASAAGITCLGVAITLQGLSAMGVLHVRF